MSEIDYLRKLLKEQKLTLALGESVTCGLAAYKMNSRPGTSEIFKGSVVAYNEDVKKNLLKIDAALIETYSAESQEVTDAMVAGLQNLIKADVYAAITGLAGTGGTESKKNLSVPFLFLCCTMVKYPEPEKDFMVLRSK